MTRKTWIEESCSGGRVCALEKVNRTGASCGGVVRVARVDGVGGDWQFGASCESLFEVTASFKGVLGGLVRTADQAAQEVRNQEDDGDEGHDEGGQRDDDRR